MSILMSGLVSIHSGNKCGGCDAYICIRLVQDIRHQTRRRECLSRLGEKKVEFASAVAFLGRDLQRMSWCIEEGEAFQKFCYLMQDVK